MTKLAGFEAILSSGELVGQETAFGVGGPAEWVARPGNVDELAELVRACQRNGVPYRVLGGGSNVLVSDDGVPGVVIQLQAEPFRAIEIDRAEVRAGAGAPLASLIGESARAGLSGLEGLVGIPGTVGGALRHNAGDRAADVGQYVHAVTVMDETGKIVERSRREVKFGYRQSNLDDVIILAARFTLYPEKSEEIVKRMKKLWILKKANQPFAFQRAGYAFRNPRGLSAAELIERSGITTTKVGQAELSDRDPKFILAHAGATSRDVLRLVDLVRSKVLEKTGVELELQMDVW